MTIAAGALRELHRIHRQLTDLRERSARGPKQISAGEANVKRGEAELLQAKENYKRARIICDEKQLQLKQREFKMQDTRTKLNQAASNREYQAFKEQIAADEKANSVLSDEILEGLEGLDEHQKIIASIDSNLGKAKEELQKVRARVSETQQQLETETSRVLVELTQAETCLPPDFKADYDRVSKVRGENTLAQLEGESCGHCFQMLTPQTINNVLLSRPVFCQSCGCLLYPPGS